MLSMYDKMFKIRSDVHQRSSYDFTIFQIVPNKRVKIYVYISLRCTTIFEHYFR